MRAFHFLSTRHGVLPWYAAFALILIGAMALEMFGLHMLATSEARMSDVFMRRHAGDFKADPGIAIVDVDDAGMAAMQDIAGLWSWLREIHADLLDALAEFTPRTVVFDIAFSEKDLKRPKSDARLSGAIQANRHVYLSAVRGHPPLDKSGVPLHQLESAFGMIGGDQRARAAIQLPGAINPAA